MSVRIVVDSTADMNPACAGRVTAVPLTVHFGQEEYTDGVSITAEEFYEKLVMSEELPRTSQATPFAFGEVFEEAVDAGDTVVAVIASSGLSGTYQSAVIAAADYPGKVFVVDSLGITIFSGILTEYALQLADQGIEAEEIASKLLEARHKVRLFAVVDTLEYLQKGGRVSKTVAIVGGLLSVKPIIAITAEGKLEMVGKARGNKMANAQMNRMVAELGIDFSKPCMLGYTGSSDALLKKYIQESEVLLEGRQLPVSIVGSVVGTHVGPNGIAIAFFTK